MSPAQRIWKISDVQQGVIAQNEFAKLVMMGSRGMIEMAFPLTDEERRDFEIHIRGQYGSALALQIKSARELANMGKARYLRVRFSVRDDRLVSDPIFWYFFAHLDPKTMRFADPTFLIPSHDLHKRVARSRHEGTWDFLFVASMEPRSQDEWAQYRVSQFELGKRLMAIIHDLRGLRSASPEVGRLLDVPGIAWARGV